MLFSYTFVNTLVFRVVVVIARNSTEAMKVLRESSQNRMWPELTELADMLKYAKVMPIDKEYKADAQVLPVIPRDSELNLSIGFLNKKAVG